MKQRARRLHQRRTMKRPPERDTTVVLRARQMMALTLASFALSGASMSAPSRGPDPSPQVEQRFQKADVDRNGRLSKSEAAAIPEIAARFDELDKDRDGSLSFEEFLSAYGAPGGR